MMKKTILTIGIIIPLIFAASLAFTDNMILGNEKGEGKQIAQSGSIPMNAIDIDKAPEQVKEWAQDKLRKEGKYVKTIGDRTYLLVAWGQKNTGGYVVNIDSVEQRDGKVVAAVSYKEPEGMVIQVITYPYALVSIPATDAEIVFVEK